MAFDEINKKFYKKLFTSDPEWSSITPNHDEAARWAKICRFMSNIYSLHIIDNKQPLRILDVGCGRGWLTNLVSIFGICDGIDPVESSIEQARQYYPEQNFNCMSLSEYLRLPSFVPYDVVVTSEVIEHVHDKKKFVFEISKCLKTSGQVIITTPRGGEFKKWARINKVHQPIEEWITERRLLKLFKSYGFFPQMHDRIYTERPDMSFFHRLAASRRLNRLTDKINLTSLNNYLSYITAIYQIWWFSLK